MTTIGITGQNGFIGSHLYNEVSLLSDEFTIIPFERIFFDDALAMEHWVTECDVIIHLAALNRHNDPEVIYSTNVGLVKHLTDALSKTGALPHVIFSSSTQESMGNLYGNSKSMGRKLLEEWSTSLQGTLTGLIIPNVFGPFGVPFYNSVVGTFCYQLCNGLTPGIDKDGSLKLIYVQDLVRIIIDAARNRINQAHLEVPHSVEYKVSEILAQLNEFKTTYLENGNIPDLPTAFSINLFNTFRSYIPLQTYFPFKLKQNTDNRGSFVEIIRLPQGGQVSFSTTHPGVTRGNHFHTRKIERFTVIKGKALIQLRKYKSEEIINYELDGDEPSYVDMPIWYVHNIKNICDTELYTVFWINEFFNPQDPDTYFELV